VFHILGPASCAIRTCAARLPTPLWRVARASREAISARTISCVSMTSTDADNASVDSTSPAEHKQLELLINPRFILQFLQSMRAFVFICNLAITGGHDKTWGHQCQKKNWGSGYFAGPFTAHDFFGSGRQFEEEGRSICFMALIWTRRLTCALIIASMRSSKAISFLRSSWPTIAAASKKDPSTCLSQRSSDGNISESISFFIARARAKIVLKSFGGNFLSKCSFRSSVRR